jgi:hypothetical protein
MRRHVRSDLYGGPGSEEPLLGKAKSVGRSHRRRDAQHLDKLHYM